MFFMMGVSWCVIGVAVVVMKNCAGGWRGFWWEMGLVFLLPGLHIPIYVLSDFRSERAGCGVVLHDPYIRHSERALYRGVYLLHFRRWETATRTGRR